MPFRSLPFVLLLGLVPAAPLAAQDVVEVSLGEGIEDPLPLEVPFRMVGRAPAGVEEIEFRYGPAPDQAPGYLPVPEPQRWVRIVDDEFAFDVWPLHARTRYRFEWRLRLRVAALERTRPGLVGRTIERLRLETGRRWRQGRLAASDAAELGRLLVEALGLPVTADRGAAAFDQRAFDDLLLDLGQARALENEFASNHGQLCRTLGETLGGTEWEPLIEALRRASHGEFEPEPGSESRWRATLDPRDRNNGTDLEQASALLVWLAEDPRLLQELLQGRRTIHRSSLLETDAVRELDPDAAITCASGGADLDALGILADALAALPALRSATGPLLEPASAELAAGLAIELRAYREDARALRRADAAARETLEQRLSELALEASVRWTATATAVADRTHPYVGLDLGVAWVPGFDGLAFYTAAQLHAVPVNRRASLSIHRGADVLLKRLSLMFGLAVTGVDSASREPLTGPGSPMLGIGFRLSRDFRLSGGRIWFEDAEGATRADWFASISYDIDLASFLGRLGRLFGG